MGHGFMRGNQEYFMPSDAPQEHNPEGSLSMHGAIELLQGGRSKDGRPRSLPAFMLVVMEICLKK
jgi:hypothetical protein